MAEQKISAVDFVESCENKIHGSKKEQKKTTSSRVREVIKHQHSTSELYKNLMADKESGNINSFMARLNVWLPQKFADLGMKY